MILNSLCTAVMKVTFGLCLVDTICISLIIADIEML
jgi:hypothetical protein